MNLTIVMVATSRKPDLLVKNCLNSLKECSAEFILFTDETSHYTSLLAGLSIDIVSIDLLFSEAGYCRNTYDEYGTGAFDRNTSLKWLSLIYTIKKRAKPVVVIDCDIFVANPSVVNVFSAVLQKHECFVQAESYSCFPPVACTGIMGFRGNAWSLKKLKQLYMMHIMADGVLSSFNDQDAFNSELRKLADLYDNCYLLPQVMFPTGDLARLYEGFEEEKLAPASALSISKPLLFHANHFAQMERKISLLDAMGMLCVAR